LTSEKDQESAFVFENDSQKEGFLDDVYTISE
jgi:hypothetical protein